MARWIDDGMEGGKEWKDARMNGEGGGLMNDELDGWEKVECMEERERQK